MRDFLFVRIPKTASSSICQVLYGSNPWPQHKTVWQLSKEVENFNSLFKFSIVRNPYERFRSLCRFYNLKPSEYGVKMTFKTMAESLCIRGKLAVNYVGRFEDLDNSFNEIAKRIGIEEKLPPHIKPHLEDLPDKKDVIEIVNNYFARDFKLFDYPMEGVS